MTIFAPTLKVSIMDNLQKSFLGFFLQTKKTKGTAKLYKKVRLSNGSNAWLNSQISIPIDSFYSRNKFNAWSKSDDYKKLMEVDALIKSLVEEGITDLDIFRDAINRVAYKEEYERQEKEKAEAEKKKAEAEKAEALRKENEKKDVLLFLHNFIDGIARGSILHKGKPYSSSTISNYRSFEKIIVNFNKEKPISFDDINRQLNDRFIGFCRNIGMMDKTINKYIICFRKLVNYAVEKEMNLSAVVLKAFSEIRVTDEDKRAEIYLPDDVINKLYSLKLSGVKEIVRDVFFVGCRSCLRFSDYSRLDRSCFSQTKKGNLIIDLTQQKTSGKVTIPILDSNIVKVMEKYDYQLPQLTEQVLNSNIKEICRELSISVPSLAKKEITLLTKPEKRQEQTYREKYGKDLFERDNKGNVVRPRWQLISSHTARRSGITNLYLTHKLTVQQMMSISGHQSEKVFMGYIKLSRYEKADEIVEAMNM